MAIKKTRFTETQIVSVLEEVDAGLKVEETCRKHTVLAFFGVMHELSRR